ncbi:MAG: hypothetical protein K8W52_24720 [Deltaproteobacteria bacterium]|nr:hypothetical protein [Deltaproteobacteria bacterium]
MNFAEASAVAVRWAPRHARSAPEGTVVQVHFRDGHHAAALRPVRIAAEPWLFVEADVADTEAISPLAALRLNDTIAVGALIHAGGRLTLRHALRQDGLDPSTLVRTLTLVAHEAARLAARLATPRATHPAAILHWLAA